jgi:hypothetical protein
LFDSVLPSAASTAGLVKFSLAISWRPPRSRSSSSVTTLAMSGSKAARASKSGPQ